MEQYVPEAKNPDRPPSAVYIPTPLAELVCRRVHRRTRVAPPPARAPTAQSTPPPPTPKPFVPPPTNIQRRPLPRVRRVQTVRPEDTPLWQHQLKMMRRRARRRQGPSAGATPTGPSVAAGPTVPVCSVAAPYQKEEPVALAPFAAHLPSRVAQIPGGPTIFVPIGSKRYRIVIGRWRYNLRLDPDTGTIRHVGKVAHNVEDCTEEQHARPFHH